MGAQFERVVTYPGIARRLFGACEWNNRIIIAGGLSPAGAYLNDVWESSDGVIWNRLATGVNSFTPAREGLVLLVHDNCLYVIGGYDGTNYHADVWMSRDGTKWDRVINGGTATVIARDDGSAFSLNGRIHYVGGDASVSGVYFSDVWSSPNGTTWNRDLNNYARIRRTVPGYCVFNNRMHIICGYDGTLATRLGTAVYSADGLHWDITGSKCGLPEVDDIAACVFDNKIVVTGGYAVNRIQAAVVGRSLYYSPDGEHYKLGLADMGFGVYQHKMVALKNPNRMFLLFGYNGSAVRTDIWMSYGNWQENDENWA